MSPEVGISTPTETMSLQGIPDFQAPIPGNGFFVYFPFESAGSSVITPSHLEIAPRDSDGRPDFRLELLHGPNPLLPPAPYGVLDFRLRPHYESDQALALARAQRSDAKLAFPSFTAGYLRMEPIAATDGVLSELQKPITLGWNALGTARFISRISQDSAVVLKQALQSEVLTLRASCAVQMEGVSPRVPVLVRFKYSSVLAAITGASIVATLARKDLVEFFRRDLAGLPLILDRALDIGTVDDFANAMADRIILHFGQLTPTPADERTPFIQLTASDSVNPDQQEWNLAEPITAQRPFWLELDPLSAARRLVQSDGLNSVVQETVIGQMQTGAHSILVTSNLPSHRPGLVECGVTLHAAANLPYRPQAIIETVVFSPPADSANAMLRLSPFEDLRYTYATFAVTQTGSTIERKQAPEIVVETDRLELSVADFPVDFAMVEASRALLDVALITGVCRALSQGTSFEQRFVLDKDCPSVALTFPKDSSSFAVQVEAQSRLGSEVISVEPSWNGGVSLDLHSFQEYGAHKVRVECQFITAGVALTALDLLAESAGNGDQIAVVHFTPLSPVKDWTYLAISPFNAGYRYRNHPNEGEAPRAWSDIQSPFEVLVITV